MRAAAQADVKPAAAGKQAALKADIIQLSGSKYGHDLTEATRETILQKVKELEELQLPVKASVDALTGTKWTTVFTTSDGAQMWCKASSGIIVSVSTALAGRHLSQRPA